MLNDLEVEYLRANTRFLVKELLRRGIDIEIIDWELEVWLARLGSHVEQFLDISSSLLPHSAAAISSDKGLVKHLLRKLGISVPKGGKFSVLESEEIIREAGLLGFPVVLKPAFGIQGECVYVDLDSDADLQHAITSILKEKGAVDVILEEQFKAPEYRIFITKEGRFAVLHRDPAHVIGNGTSTILALAEEETFHRMNPRTNCLCPIIIDEEVERFLRRQNQSLQNIPVPGEKVYLRSSSNVKLGGVCDDYSDQVHPTVIAIALEALRSIPGLAYAGVDFMSCDITTRQDPEMYRILEINCVPGIGMHIHPAKGRSRNVAGILADLIFPESAHQEIARAA